MLDTSLNLIIDVFDEVPTRRCIIKEDMPIKPYHIPLLTYLLCNIKRISSRCDYYLNHLQKTFLWTDFTKWEKEISKLRDVAWVVENIERVFEDEENEDDDVKVARLIKDDVEENLQSVCLALEALTEKSAFMEMLHYCCRELWDIYHVIHPLVDILPEHFVLAPKEVKAVGWEIMERFLTKVMSDAKNAGRSQDDVSYWRELFDKELAAMQSFLSPDGKKPFCEMAFVFEGNQKERSAFYDLFVRALRKARISDPEILRIVARMEIINDVVAHLREAKAKEEEKKEVVQESAEESKTSGSETAPSLSPEQWIEKYRAHLSGKIAEGDLAKKIPNIRDKYRLDSKTDGNWRTTWLRKNIFDQNAAYALYFSNQKPLSHKAVQELLQDERITKNQVSDAKKKRQ